MQVPKDHVKVKIKTESAVIRGTVHTMVDGRLSDYMTTHVGKFIPVTNATVFYIEKTGADIKENGIERKVVFVNVEKIEMIEYL
ncbi:MAG: hypothetical protein MUO59_06170 [Actinobacteria bacterium]|nr:hypothetical protein [Actinomycetota bacterium]